MTRRALIVAGAVLALVVVTPDPARSSHTDTTTHTVITVGTSIEAGSGHAPGESWPQRLDTRTSATITDMSLGGGGYTYNNSAGDNIGLHVDAAIAQHPDTIVLGGPVNDLVSLYDVTPLRWAVFNAAGRVQAAGIKVVVMDILPFTDCGGCAFPVGWWPSLEPRRTAYNDWATAMYGADNVDVAWALKETGSTRGDLRWYRDGLHLTRVSAALVAEAFPTDRL